MIEFIEVHDFHHGGSKLIAVPEIMYIEKQKDGSATIEIKGTTRYFHVKSYNYVMEQLNE